MRPYLIFSAVLLIIGLSLGHVAAGPVLPQQHDGRLVHPGSPLDVVMASEHNDVGWLQSYPIDLTGLPGWMLFNQSSFAKDGNIGKRYAHFIDGQDFQWYPNLTIP